MAAPNIVNVTSIYGKTMGAVLGTTSSQILTCPSNKVLKINSIIVANVDGVDPRAVTVSFYDLSTTESYKLASTVTVPQNSTLIVLGKDSPIYLEESDRIDALASVASDLEIIISYEELDDA